MRHHQVLQSPGINTLQETGSLLITQMPPLPAYTLLERGGIATISQHRRIMIRFEHHRIAGLVAGLNVGRNTTQISQYSQAETGKFKNNLRRFPGIMGNSHWPDGQAVNLKRCIGVDQAQIREFTQVATVKGAGRHVNRNLVTARQSGNAFYMIRVFVGNENRRQLVGAAGEL